MSVQSPREASDLHLGVIGLGSIGRRHIENARALGVSRITLVRSGRPDAVPNEWGYAEVPSVEALLDEGVAAAVVCTPTALHVGPTLAALLAGLPVLVEKPLADRMEAVVPLLALPPASRSRLVAAHNLRFHPGIVAAHGLLTSGAVGRPVASRFFVGQYLPEWRPGRDYRQTYSARRALGGGVLLDLIHEIDLAAWWCGPFREVSAWVGHASALEIDADDVSELLLAPAQGGIVTVHLDYLFHPYARWAEVTGDDGTMRFDYAANRLTVAAVGAAQRDVPLPPFDRNDMYLALMRHFLDVALHGASPRVTLADAVDALHIADAARRASDARRWLPLPAAHAR